jgi:hypothetical protein
MSMRRPRPARGPRRQRIGPRRRPPRPASPPPPRAHLLCMKSPRMKAKLRPSSTYRSPLAPPASSSATTSVKGSDAICDVLRRARSLWRRAGGSGVRAGLLKQSRGGLLAGGAAELCMRPVAAAAPLKCSPRAPTCAVRCGRRGRRPGSRPASPARAGSRTRRRAAAWRPPARRLLRRTRGRPWRAGGGVGSGVWRLG